MGPWVTPRRPGPQAEQPDPRPNRAPADHIAATARSSRIVHLACESDAGPGERATRPGRNPHRQNHDQA
eukprot:13021213-Alexandrium_andersonii.AAC.1